MDVISFTRIFASHPFFRGLEPVLLDRLAGCAANQRFEAESFLFRAGKPAEWFAILREGTVSLEVYTPHRAPLPIQILGAGDLLGWSWLVAPYQWHFDARALEPVRMVSFDAGCLRAGFESDHELGYQMYQRFFPVVMQRLQATRMQLLELYELESGG